MASYNPLALWQVPSYSPGSIAEYAIAQIMALAKNTHMSYVMTKKANFEVTSMQVIVGDTDKDGGGYWTERMTSDYVTVCSEEEYLL